MKIYVQNHSTVLTNTTIQSWLPALHSYAGRVAHSWGLITPTLAFETPPTSEEWQLVFLDTSDQAGALGYHDYTPGGRPIAKVFAKSDQHYGASVTVTATHELAEMIVDPWIVTAMQTSATRLYAVEVGDPVEADTLGFQVTGSNGVAVLCSDYVTKDWFIPGAPGPFDHERHCSQPLQVLAGGYAQFYDGSGWHQVNENAEVVATGERAERWRTP